jgi:hypothetical protein
MCFSLQETIQKIITKRATKMIKERRVAPIVAVPVANVQLNTDVRSSINSEIRLVLPFLEVAQPLSGRLLARVAEMERAQQQRKLP